MSRSDHNGCGRKKCWVCKPHKRMGNSAKARTPAEQRALDSAKQQTDHG
jgi:hypothetical protein